MFHGGNDKTIITFVCNYETCFTMQIPTSETSKSCLLDPHTLHIITQMAPLLMALVVHGLQAEHHFDINQYLFSLTYITWPCAKYVCFNSVR